MDLIAALKNAIGENFVREGDAIPHRNWADMAEMPPVAPAALILPGSTAEVSAVLSLCSRAGQRIVVQGGMTGLAGGAHPQDGEFALSLERLQGIDEIDVSGRTMIARAGTPLYKVQEAAKDAGLHYGVDLGARGSCTIGGTVATNAGGVQALRYGVTRRNVLGLEVVLADGTVLDGLNRLMKIGSEGTLGVITRVSLSLSPALPAYQSALCACASADDAVAALGEIDRLFPGRLVTFEGMWREYMDVTARMGKTREPFAERAEITLLIEAALGDDEAAQDQFAEALAGLLERGMISDALIAQSLQDRQRFWDYREANYEFDSAMPGAIHLDVSLPTSKMDEAIDHMRRETAARSPGCIFIAYGHMADSNLHLSLFRPEATTDLHPAAEALYEAVGRFRGSVSAEHGIGVLKRRYLSRSRKPDEIALMKGFKRMLDPANILNRGRIFSLD
jgi:FAD/FMN-containing dehydrogenase